MIKGTAGTVSKSNPLAVKLISICLLVWLVAALPVLGQTKPGWLGAYLEGSLEIKGVYFGVGFAGYDGKTPAYDDIRLAKDRALDGLCYQLSVTIQSEFQETMTKKGDYEEQQIASSLFVSARNVFSGVEERERWADQHDRRYWVLVSIEKSRAQEQLEKQNFINEVVDRLEHRQEEIRAGIQDMAGLLERNMAVYDRRIGELENLLTLIDTKMDAADSQTRTDYDRLQQAVSRLEESRNRHEQTMLQIQNQRDDRIEALIRENRELKQIMLQVAGKIQGDYFLSLAEDDLKNQAAHPGSGIRIKPDRGQGAGYAEGDIVKFFVSATRDCYIKVTYISVMAAGSGKQSRVSTLLFPNDHDRSNRIRAGETKIIGQMGELVIQPPYGKDIITVMAAESQFDDLGQVLQASRGGYYSEVSANTRNVIQIRKRGIGVAKVLPHPPGQEKAGTDSKGAVSNWVGSDTCFIITRPRP